MKLPTVLTKSALSAIKPQVDAFKRMQVDIQASDELMTRIAGLLVHSPQEWRYIHQDHPLRARMLPAIRELIPYLPDSAVILSHSHEKWCLIAFDNAVYPAIFKSNVIDTHFFKTIGGAGSRWLPPIRTEIVNILANYKYEDGETSVKLTQTTMLPGARLRL